MGASISGKGSLVTKSGATQSSLFCDFQLHFHMPGPATYDASSASEQPVTLPDAPTRRINEALSIQPPLSRRGHGPGLVLFLSNETSSAGGDKPLDPEPVQKWAEEGFAVAFVTVYPTIDVQQILAEAARALIDLGDTLDISDKFGVIGELGLHGPPLYYIPTYTSLRYQLPPRSRGICKT